MNSGIVKSDRIVPLDETISTSAATQIHTVNALKRWRLTKLVSHQQSQQSIIHIQIAYDGTNYRSRMIQLDQDVDAAKSNATIECDILLEAGAKIRTTFVTFTAADTVNSQVIGEEWDA